MHLVDLRVFFYFMLVQLPKKGIKSGRKGEAEGATWFESSNEVQSVRTGVMSGAI